MRSCVCPCAGGRGLAAPAILKRFSNSNRQIAQAYITAPLLCCSLPRQSGDKHGKMPRERKAGKTSVSFPTFTSLLQYYPKQTDAQTSSCISPPRDLKAKKPRVIVRHKDVLFCMECISIRMVTILKSGRILHSLSWFYKQREVLVSKG